MADNSKKDVAQAQFAKLQRANDAKQATADYEAEALAMRAKTERLRALRLARDAQTGAVAEAAPPAKAKAKAGAKKMKAADKPAGTLADWIKAREAGGHKN